MRGEHLMKIFDPILNDSYMIVISQPGSCIPSGA